MHVHGHTWFTAPIEIPLSQSGSSDGSKCWFCFFFCMHWLGRVDSAYTFSSVVCMRMLGRSRIILPDNPEFIPVAQTNTCSSSSSSVIVEKKGVQHKIKAIPGQFSTDHHVFMHISKHFDDSLNTRLHIHHFVSSSLHNFRWNNFYVAHISHCVRAENVGRATKPTTLRWA